MELKMETPLNNLYRKIVITACARFEASRRLLLHHQLSLWTVSLFSVGIIVYQLIEILEIKTAISKPTLIIVQIVSSLVIIVFSVLVNVSRFSERAVRMHEGALEINELAGKLFPFLSNSEDSRNIYNEIRNKYDNILKRYDNHGQIDYRVAQQKKASDRYWLGYRVYYAYESATVVLLLYGGIKRTQAADIKTAVRY